MPDTYEIDFTYRDKTIGPRKGPKVTSFAIDTGDAHDFDINFTNDTGIAFGLEQSRKSKNLVLLMPKAAQPSDMTRYYELTGLFRDRTPFEFVLSIRKFMRSKQIFAIQLSDKSATVKQLPIVWRDDLVRVEFALPGAQIRYTDGRGNATYL